MITFDKIKLVSKLDYLTVINHEVFEIRTKNNITTLVFNQKKPYSLFLQVTPIVNEVVIEFTGKILLDDYPRLISHETISNCLENINKLGFCKLKTENIIEDSELVKCDVTKDFQLVLKNDIKKILISQQSNFKFHIQKYLTGYTMTKDVKTDNCKMRLSIYDKFAEMLTAPNKPFLNELDDSEVLMNYFKNKYRIEANLITKEHVRKYLNISDNSLIRALRSDENPLMEIFNVIFDASIESTGNSTKTRNLFEYESLSQLKDVLLLKECNYDLSKTEEILNHYLAENTNKRKYRSKYRKLIDESIPVSENRFVVGEIREQLKAS